MNFKKYWEQNKELYSQLGVTKAVAYKIWCDAADAVEKEMAKVLMSNL